MPVVYETNADIPSFGGINTTGDGYNMSLRLARDMMNVDCSNGGFTQFREGKEMPQHLNEPIETLEILHRRWGLREDGIVHEKPDWLVAVAGGKVYTKELDGDDEWTLRYEGLQESKCSCVAYEVNDFPPFVVGELVARVGDDNKSLIATMPEVSGGSGEYKLNYILQKISGSVVGDVIGGAYITDEVTLLSLENGLYRVKLVASDGTSEETRYSSSFVLSGYGAYGSLRVEVGEAYLDNDNVTIVCPKPTVTGGYPETPGGYTYSYTIYDSNGACVAYFYSDDDLIYVRTPYNGHFIIHVSVSDGKSTVTEDYGWFEVNAHQQLTEINVGYLEAQLLDNKKGFIIKRPEAGGGSGVYRYLYSLNRIEGEKAVQESYFLSYDEYVTVMTARNGRYSVQVIVQDENVYDGDIVILQGGHYSRSTATYWTDITGHDEEIEIERPEDKSYPMDVLLLTNAKDGMFCLRGDGQVLPVETPYKFGLIERSHERIWGTAIEDEPDVVVYSRPYDPMDWSADEELPEMGGGEVRQPTFDGDSFVALKRFSNYLLAFKKNAVWRITGSDPSNITFREGRGVGTIAPMSIVSTPSHVWMMTWFGLARYNGSYSHPFQAEATRGFLQDLLTDTDVGNIVACEHDGTLYMAYPADGSPVNNRVLMYTSQEQSFSVRDDMKVTRFLSHNNRLFYATADAPGRVFEVDSTGKPLPVRWVSGYQDMGIKGSIKSAFTVYFQCEAEAPFPLTIGIRTEKKLKQKQLVITPGKAYHKIINVQGRYFRVELSSDTLEPFRINGGIRIHMELDPD